MCPEEVVVDDLVEGENRVRSLRRHLASKARASLWKWRPSHWDVQAQQRQNSDCSGERLEKGQRRETPETTGRLHGGRRCECTSPNPVAGGLEVCDVPMFASAAISILQF